MNNVTLIGRLTRDPELRYTQTGMGVVRFTIAVDRKMSKQKRQEIEAQNGQTADFISCTAFNQTAELIANYLRKGSQIGIEGRIQTGSYEKDGVRVYTTDVIVNSMDFIGSSNNNQSVQNQGGFNPVGQRPYSQNSANMQNPPVNSAYAQNDYNSQNNDDEFFPIDNDDIPF